MKPGQLPGLQLIQKESESFFKRRTIYEHIQQEVHNVRWKDLRWRRSGKHSPLSHPPAYSYYALRSNYHITPLYYLVTTRNVRRIVQDPSHIRLTLHLRSAVKRLASTFQFTKRRYRGTSMHAFIVASTPESRSTTSSSGFQNLLTKSSIQSTLICSSRTTPILFLTLSSQTGICFLDPTERWNLSYLIFLSRIPVGTIMCPLQLMWDGAPLYINPLFRKCSGSSET